jgi:hypothetical protein
VKSKVNSIIINIFFDTKVIVQKEFALTGQIVNSSYYCDGLRRLHKNMRRLCPEFWKKELALNHDNASYPVSLFFFHQESLDQNNMTVVPHPHRFSLFSRLKIKLKGRHFDATEVKEAESQAVLNTLTEHYFQDAFKKWQKRWERCICEEGGYF